MHVITNFNGKCIPWVLLSGGFDYDLIIMDNKLWKQEDKNLKKYQVILEILEILIIFFYYI